MVAKTGSAPAPTPQPAPAPAPEGGGVVEYVNVVTGADILADQAGGVPLRVSKARMGGRGLGVFFRVSPFSGQY